MAQIDIELPDELQAALAQPLCLDKQIPKPKKLNLTVPGGGRIQGIVDATNAIPNDCSLTVSLMLQLGPILANLECFIRVLSLIKPLIDVIKGLPFPPVQAIKDFGEAVPPVIDCFVNIFASIPAFIRDILCLIIKLLGCMIQQMESLLALLGGLQLDIDAALEGGNTDLLDTLECARDSAMNSAMASSQAVEPIVLILELAAPLFEFTPAAPIEIPSFVPAEDMETAQQLLAQVKEFRDVLQFTADALGGCN